MAPLSRLPAMMKNQLGFSLVELMYTLAVAALIMGVGIPAFNNTMRNASMTASTNSIVTALHAARSEAVKRRARVTVCPAELSGPDPVCQPNGSSLLVFTNVGDDATLDTADGDVVIQFQEWTRGDITTSSDNLPGYVTYAPSGFTRLIGGGPLTGDLVFCDARGDALARVLSISATGRPQIRKHADVAGVPTCS